MTAWVELALGSREKTFDQLASAVAALPSFAEVEAVRARAVLQELESDARGWCLWIETQGGAGTLHAVEILAPVLPGFTRCRKFARPAPGDVSVTLDELADSSHALSALKGIALDAGPARESRRVEWRIGDVLATLAAQDDERPTLCLSAPGDDETVLDAVFRLAREAVDAAPFSLLAVDDEAPEAPEVHASKIDLPLESTAREAFVTIAGSIAMHWFGNDARARQALEVERVHQLRVAQRRLKTLLKLFPDDVDTVWNETIAPDLKWFGDLLGDARDWDVFTDTTLPAYGEADAGGPSWQAVIDAADARRHAARTRLAHALHAKRYARLSLAFVEWLARIGMRPDEAPVALADFAKKRIRKNYRKIVEVPDLTTLDVRTRHRVRIHAKRLRYALEFLRSLTTRQTRGEIAKRLSRLQTVLGEGNDAAVAAERLSALPEASDYQRGFARAWAAVSEHKDAEEGERILRSIEKPRLKKTGAHE